VRVPPPFVELSSSSSGGPSYSPTVLRTALVLMLVIEVYDVGHYGRYHRVVEGPDTGASRVLCLLMWSIWSFVAPRAFLHTIFVFGFVFSFFHSPVFIHKEGTPNG
jgi:hypothetical protein